MEIITLQWKEFSVPVDRLLTVLKTLLSSNFDGLVCREANFDVVFLSEISQEDSDALTNFWDTATEVQFSPSLHDIVAQKINEASAFGRALILDVAVKNVMLGITQSGKTRAVADYCSDVQRYLESGSLYAALSAMDEKLAAGAPAELGPFITNARLQEVRDQIADYLEV